MGELKEVLNELAHALGIERQQQVLWRAWLVSRLARFLDG